MAHSIRRCVWHVALGWGVGVAHRAYIYMSIMYTYSHVFDILNTWYMFYMKLTLIIQANEHQQKELAEVRREKERVVASKDEEIARLQLQSKEQDTHLDELQSTCEQTVEEKKVELASKGEELASVAVLEVELQTKNQQVKQYKKQVDSYKAEPEKCQAALQQVDMTCACYYGW